MLLFASCNSASEPVATLPLPASPTPLPAPTKEITMMLKTDDFVMENWAVMDELFKRSGISCLVKTIRPARYIETLNVNLSSGKIYDIMELPPAYAHAADEYIINATPLINTFAPNYINWLNKLPNDILASLATGQGEIKIFPLRHETGEVRAMPFIKKEVTGREFDAVSFYNAVSQSGGKFAVPGSTMTLCELMAPMFATTTDAKKANNEIVFGPLTEEFKSMLLYLNSMYTKKLLSESFFVYSPTNLKFDIKSGAVTAGMFTEKYYEDAFSAGMEPFMFTPVAGATLPRYSDLPTSYAGLTSAKGNQETAIQFIEYCFSPEGRRLLNNGVSNLHASYHDNGVISPLEPYTKAGSFQFKEQGISPEGMPGIYYNTWTRFEQPLYDKLIPMRKYAATSQDTYLSPLPVVGKNAQYSQTIKGAIDPILNEWWTEFIVGNKSLSSNWGEYVKAVKYAGLDTYLKLHYR
jgi:hypothetical protein